MKVGSVRLQSSCPQVFVIRHCNHEMSSNQLQPLKFVVTRKDCCVVVAFCTVPFIKGSVKRSLEMGHGMESA
jgi:hypothetical protein